MEKGIIKPKSLVRTRGLMEKVFYGKKVLVHLTLRCQFIYKKYFEADHW